jgi:hypothetical protein
MAISPDTRLGRYEIRSPLGAGGMGEVYLARDPKINRDVAIKVLPAAFSSDSERLRRFEQEAQAAGALNHPNILSIYDVDTHDGMVYVVSELLQGETLREKLNGATLSQRRAIDYSNESGTWQVYVRNFPASGGKWQVSTAGGAQPQWRRDGRELFYISPDRKLMAMEVKGDGSTFEAGVPKVLFELRTSSFPGVRNFYVAAADGQRFLVTSLLEEATATPTTVVLNWTADLKR